MGKIMLISGATIEETFNDFILSRKIKGLAEKTIESYQHQFKAVSKHLDVSKSVLSLQKKDLEEMIISMRESNLSSNTINTYTRMLKSFFSWCNEEDITDVNIKLYKCEETIKETYSDMELDKLLKKPDMRKSDFSEYRNWVIINFLMNSGSRAATIRAIQNRDVDLENGIVFYRHNKNKKVQSIPLCSPMISILREYMKIRKGNDTDYLFCNQYGEHLSESALRQSIVRYNHSRGVQKTSIHLFRHTFARKYLIDCGGDAFTLQKLLGHSTLKMTKHYCNIFDADLTKNFDNYSPLAQLKSKSNRIKLNCPK